MEKSNRGKLFLTSQHLFSKAFEKCNYFSLSWYFSVFNMKRFQVPWFNFQEVIILFALGLSLGKKGDFFPLKWPHGTLAESLLFLPKQGSFPKG